MLTTLIEPAELAAHLTDADWAVVDCRFDLADTSWGERAYGAGHIPGALYAHLDRDLSGAHGPRTRAPSAARGRGARRDVRARSASMRQVQVVAYDQGPGAYAARLWWLLRWLGHPSRRGARTAASPPGSAPGCR